MHTLFARAVSSEPRKRIHHCLSSLEKNPKHICGTNTTAYRIRTLKTNWGHPKRMDLLTIIPSLDSFPIFVNTSSVFFFFFPPYIMKTYFALFAAFNILTRPPGATAVACRCRTAIPHGTLTATIQYRKKKKRNKEKEESAETTQSNGTELTENSIRRA